jgi:hypothetical protein
MHWVCMILPGECKDVTTGMDGIGAYYNEVKNNVPTLKEPSTKRWMMREFALRLPEKHRLAIGSE